jgi:hypothetical protein
VAPEVGHGVDMPLPELAPGGQDLVSRAHGVISLIEISAHRLRAGGVWS